MTLIATQVKRRRGTTAENDAFTGAEGEITVDTTTHELRVHDGSTVGGHTIPTKNSLSTKANVALDNLTSAGINFVAHASMPDYSARITLSNISSYQQITDDGYIWWSGTGGGSWSDIGIIFSLNGSTDNTYINVPSIYGSSMMVPVSKGTYVKSYGATSTIVFIPCKKGA